MEDSQATTHFSPPTDATSVSVPRIISMTRKKSS